ncbi:MAG: hypothetical protein GY795_49180 [Desulfobacterales bacterium]|nr:hypothetical protein [Desulfobacterales bacterium]
MISFKQHELIDNLFQIVKAEFPSKKENNILLDYGYWISVIPDIKEA